MTNDISDNQKVVLSKEIKKIYIDIGYFFV